MNATDKFITMISMVLFIVSGIAVHACNSPYFVDVTFISAIIGATFIFMCFVLWILDKETEKEERAAAKAKEEKQRIKTQKREKEKKIKKEKDKIELEQNEKEAYKKNRPSRTAKAAEMMDVMESSKRRM